MITLVTGATGFIGRPLVGRLLADGEAVRVLVQPQISLPDQWHNRVDVSVGDLKDPSSLKRAVQGVTTVYHLAGETRDASLFAPVNVGGTHNLLAACAVEGCLRVLHTSSLGVVGARRSGYYDEDSACSPRKPYEVSKLHGERIAHAFGEDGRLRVTVVRPAWVFGARVLGPSDSFLSWLRAIKRGRFRFIGSGPAVANYVYVEDVAAACVELARSDEAVGQTYHITDPCAIEDLVLCAARIMDVPPPARLPRVAAHAVAAGFELLGKVTGSSPPLTFSRVRALTSRVTFKNEKLRRVLELPVGWREGVRRTVQAYQQAQLL